MELCDNNERVTFSVRSHWGALFYFHILLEGRKHLMKKLVSLLLIIITIFVLASCNISDDLPNSTQTENTTSNSHQENETQETTNNAISNDKLPYDEYGLYEEKISDLLNDLGTIYWDPIKEYYVLTPRDTFRQVILAIVKDPFNEMYLDYWDKATNLIRVVSEAYPSAICVRNPASSSSYLFIVVMGEIGYDAF